MKPVLVDTSVWRRYLAGRTSRQEAQTVDSLLDEDRAVLVHTAVIGELVLGGLATREQDLLCRLPRAPEISSAEVLTFIEHHELPRRGVGWVDTQLLASTLVASATLWSFDRKLAAVAADLEIAFVPASPAPT